MGRLVCGIDLDGLVLSQSLLEEGPALGKTFLPSLFASRIVSLRFARPWQEARPVREAASHSDR